MLAVSGCVFSPSLGDGRVRCGADGACPPGFVCGSDALCWLPGSLADMSLTCGLLHCFVGWCGPISDACGQMIDCGSCNPGGGGGGGGMGVVDMAGCSPSNSCVAGASCGRIDDGCGRPISCGDCAVANTCSSTSRNSCVCVPKTCAMVSATCGNYPDGCGHVLDCWPMGGMSCGAGNSEGTCGGGGPYTCGKNACTRLSACPSGACGKIPDGCSSFLDCGACPAGQICGGRGQPNRCG
jgi:hypothetical protein